MWEVTNCLVSRTVFERFPWLALAAGQVHKLKSQKTFNITYLLHKAFYQVVGAVRGRLTLFLKTPELIRDDVLFTLPLGVRLD